MEHNYNKLNVHIQLIILSVDFVLEFAVNSQKHRQE